MQKFYFFWQEITKKNIFPVIFKIVFISVAFFKIKKINKDNLEEILSILFFILSFFIQIQLLIGFSYQIDLVAQTFVSRNPLELKKSFAE